MLLLFAYGVILFLIITRGWTTNVPKHIRAPRAVACDIFLLRVSAHHWHVSAFKKTPDNIRRSGVSKYLSLRWHYPNQVLGRNFWFPLSLHHKLPIIEMNCSMIWKK